MAVGVRPRLPHPPTYDLGINIGKCQPHTLGKGEIFLPIAAVVAVEEDSARAARLFAMRQVEILIAPFLVLGVRVGPERIAGALHCSMKIRLVFGVGIYRREVGAAAEPTAARR